MAKRRPKAPSRPTPPTGAALTARTVPEPATTAPRDDVVELAAELMDASTTAPDLPAEEAPQPARATPLSEEEFLEAARQVLDLRERYESARARLSDRETSLADEKEALDVKVGLVATREGELNTRDAALIERELDADNGYQHREAEWLERFGAQQLDIGNEARTLVAQALREVQALEQELVTKQAEAWKAIEDQRVEVDAARRELTLEHRRIAAERLDLDLERTSVEGESPLQREVARLSVELTANRARATEYEQALERSEHEVARLQDQLRTLGHRPPEVVAAELQGLQTQVLELEAALSERPTYEEAKELRDLESRAARWRGERSRLQEQVAAMQQDLDTARLATMQLKGAEQTREAYKAAVQAYHTQIDELRGELTVLGDDRRSRTPFERCSTLDESARHAPTLSRAKPNLKSLVDDVQQRVAASGFFYEPRTLRSFFAGLAVSQLHLLQGISGTGKSSLPREVARALGAHVEVVEVQAGWRDRQDLLGFYNPFENRFVETPFLEALYKAHCPQYATRPVFVVLDEMNLSQPEQYFADFLAQLEQPAGERRVRVMSFRHEAAPKEFKDGVSLTVPPNVWFIGTANHDETTVSFAPKTYDRSHVMELPDTHTPFPVSELEESDPVPTAHLQRLFEDARRSQVAKAQQAEDYLTSMLGPRLRSDFRLSWGNRTGGQLKTHVAVVTAAGGSVAEALDDFCAYKILYRLRGRQEILADKLLALKSTLQSTWPGEQPTACLSVLDREIASKAF